MLTDLTPGPILQVNGRTLFSPAGRWEIMHGR